MVDPNRDGLNKELSRPHLPRYWWWLLALLVIWNLILFWPQTAQQVQLSYSDFLAQLKAGNVTSVVFQGSQIQGDLAQPIADPSAVATATAEASATSPASTNSASNETSIPTYGYFKTRLPDAVGDPQLLGMLEAQHVKVVAQP